MKNASLLLENNLQLFYEATHIPFCVFDNEAKVLLRYPVIKSMDCSPTTLGRCCKILNKKKDGFHFPSICSSEFCFIALLKLDQDTNVMFGPVSPIPMTYQEFYQRTSDKSDPDDLTHLYRVMQQSPHISLMQFASNISLFVKLAFGEIISAQEMLSKQIVLSDSTASSIAVSTPELRYISSSEALAIQKRILFHIRNGNVQEIKDLLESTQFLTNLRNASFDGELQKIFFIFATLCCAAAVEEGLDAQKAFSIFDTYASKTTSLTTPASVAQLCLKLSIDYCQQIMNLHQFQSDSPVVTQCLQYIQSNLYSKISICDLANHCKLSKRTITRHFAEYYHMSVYEYILLAKLKEAAFLLEHSEFSLAEISAYLCFSSQSHFCTAFKKKYYYTPQQYREKFRKSQNI